MFADPNDKSRVEVDCGQTYLKSFTSQLKLLDLQAISLI